MSIASSVEFLTRWAHLQNIEFVDSCVRESQDGKGLGLFRDTKTEGEREYITEANGKKREVLLRIPADLVVTATTIRKWSASNARLHKFFESLGPLYRQQVNKASQEKHSEGIQEGEPVLIKKLFDPSDAETWPLRPREVIHYFLIFLLEGIKQGHVGHLAPWVKVLPLKDLTPISWKEKDMELLYGTSIYNAVKSKRQKLEDTYANYLICLETSKFEELNLNDNRPSGKIDLAYLGSVASLDEWIIADQWISSRSLELSSGELAMVPVLDFANHSTQPNARYEVKQASGEILLLSQSSSDESPDNTEITISYGPDKGMGEMVFNYGFVDKDTEDARSLSLQIPVDLVAHIQGDDFNEATYMMKMMTYTMFGGLPLLKFERDPESLKVIAHDDLIWFLVANENDGLQLAMEQVYDDDGNLEEKEAFYYEGRRLEAIGDSLIHLIRQKLREKPTVKAKAAFVVEQIAEHYILELIDSKENIENNDAMVKRPNIANTAFELVSRELKLLSDWRGDNPTQEEDDDLR